MDLRSGLLIGRKRRRQDFLNYFTIRLSLYSPDGLPSKKANEVGPERLKSERTPLLTNVTKTIGEEGMRGFDRRETSFRSTESIRISGFPVS